MQGILNVIFLILWFLSWIIGGWWIVRAVFKLQPEEEGVSGLIIGLAAEVVLANFIARVIPLNWAAWVSAAVVLLAGFLLAFTHGGWQTLKVKIIPGQWLAFAVITYGFFLVSRGLALYDDYAHLPTLSIMATGAIPPHFAIDPDIPYGYHYFLLLFGAQIMRLGGCMPWTAWDFARAFTVAPAVLLAGLWAYRITRNKVAAFLGNLGVLFISGTRWLLLLVPGSILSKISTQVQLIGAGAASGPTLAASLPNTWPVDGQGSFPLPYAFENGVFTSGAEGVLSVFGLMLTAVFLVLLLTGTRWKNNWAIPITIILVASLGLLTEIEILLMAVAIVLFALVWIIRARRFTLPAGLKKWLLIWLVGGTIIAVEGGTWTGTLQAILAHLLCKTAPLTYQATGLQFASPSIVSTQLGILSLLDIRSILISLFEIGPIIFVLPLLAIWGWKAARAQRWFEATYSLAALLSLGMIFIHFSAGVRQTARLYFFVPASVVMAVPLIWLWASHRKPLIRKTCVALGGVAMFGGVVMLGMMFPNIKNNQFSFFISPYDAAITENYWNKLAPGALVFDSNPYRATTIFGRYTRSGTSWVEDIPEYTRLSANPDAYQLVKDGFSYAYIDQNYWQNLSPASQAAFEQPCVVLIKEMNRPGNQEAWRKLYDLRGCQ